jgi:hypothetical protein
VRSLDEVRTDILAYYHEADLSIADAVGKAAPFDDLDADALESVIVRGLIVFVQKDVQYLRAHPVTDARSRRVYLGRFQLRPEFAATAAAVYANLGVRFDVDDGNRRVIDFERGDIAHVLDNQRAGRDGLERRIEFFEWLDSQFASRTRKRVGDLPKHVLVEADKRAGEAFK